MGQYIVSARKYRPDSFESLIGQDTIVKTLKNSIVRGQLAHAYLFCGPRGVGKTSAARIFAKTINCEHPTENMEPCGECESCISFKEGRSFCIHELDAASNNGVDDIKALIDQVNIPPQIGRYSVYIVDEVHMLSSQAFNAFLKTLEEPPAHAIFILATTEKHKILPTILSRCQTYDFNRISIPDMVRNLRGIAANEGISVDDESLHIIAQKADGAMRDALTIFDQTVAFCGNVIKYEDVIRNLNVLDYEHCFHLVDCFLSGDCKGALLKFDELLSKGFNALHFVAALSAHFRDLIVSRCGGLDSLLELPESLKAKYSAQAGRCPMQFLYDGLSVTTQCESGYRASVNPRLHIEFALMKLCFLCGKSVSLKAPEIKIQEPDPTGNDKAANSIQAGNPTGNAGPAMGPTGNISEKRPDSPAAPPAGPTGEAASPARGARRTVKAASALSISALQDSGKTASASLVNNNDSADSPAPSDEKIKESWSALIAGYASRPRLHTTLTGARLEISGDKQMKTVTFFVINEGQRDWIKEKLLSELERKLQRHTGSGKLRLEVSVQEEDEVERKIYSPDEKAKALMESNPEIKNLVTAMELDVK